MMKTNLKKLLACLLFSMTFFSAAAQNNLGIGTATPDASAKLDVSATDKGILIPRMTTAARNAITTPAKGLMVYDSTVKAFYYHDGAAWAAVGVVPKGGTTGQVLAKVNATDYNTQWVTPSTSSTYPNIELMITNNTTQVIPITSAANSSIATQITFSGTNSANAALTGGNTWNGTTFTIGATGAGWYQITAQIVGAGADGVATNSVGIPFYMDINNAIGVNMSSAIKYRSNYSSITQTNHLKNMNTIITTIYLSAGNVLNFYGISASTAVGTNTSSNGSTYLNIVRIK